MKAEDGIWPNLKTENTSVALKRPDLSFVTFSSFAKENEIFDTMVNACILLILVRNKKNRKIVHKLQYLLCYKWK